MINYRLGNIELRVTKSIINKEEYYEIVCWYPNGYYGRQNEFVLDEKRQMYYKPEDRERGCYTYLSPSAFKNKECCYTICIVESRDDEEPDLRSVGRRPFTLESDDKENYYKVVKFLYDNWDRCYGN